MEGNATKKVLQNIESLSHLLSQHSEQAFQLGQPFLETLKAFDAVVHSSFGGTLLEGWEGDIAEFSAQYSSLLSTNSKPVSITPKVGKIHINIFIK